LGLKLQKWIRRHPYIVFYRAQKRLASNMVSIPRFFRDISLSQSKYFRVTLLCLLSFAIGIVIGKERKFVDVRTLSDISKGEPAFRRTLKEALDNSLYSFSAREFACDTRRAYNELTRLHKRKIELRARQEAGEANRARIATINRKADEASAAESSFRSCIEGMIPELLERWDHDSANNKLNYNTWDESKEKSIEGITMDVLLQTAKEIE